MAAQSTKKPAKQSGACWFRYHTQPFCGPANDWSGVRDLEPDRSMKTHDITENQRLFVRAQMNPQSNELSAREKEVLQETLDFWAQKTSPANHLGKFLKFVKYEEIALEDCLAAKDPKAPVRLSWLREVKVKEATRTFYRLELPEKFELPDEWRNGGYIWIQNIGDNTSLPSKLLCQERSDVYLDGNTIEVCFQDGFEGRCRNLYQREVMDLEFRMFFQHHRYPFKSMCEAVTYGNQFQPSVLFPTAIRRSLPWIVEEIYSFFNEAIGRNRLQRQAVVNIVNPRQTGIPYILFGPPGTGKTAVLVECVLLILSLYPTATVLICTGSNAAADVFVERLCREWPVGIMGDPANTILRLNSLSRVVVDVSDRIMRCSRIKTHRGQQRFFLPGAKDISAHRVVVSTCMNATRLINSDRRKMLFQFTYLFLDEAAQMTEPESLIPLSLYEGSACGSFVLAGDYKQLGPVLQSQHTKKVGYGTDICLLLDISLMERLIHLQFVYKSGVGGEEIFNPLLGTMLEESYRCDPALLEFSSGQFYGGRLIARANNEETRKFLDWETLPMPTVPMAFINVVGEEHSNPEGSYSNEAEGRTVVRWLKLMRDEKSVAPHDVIVITPYAAQVKLITSLLSNTDELKKVAVGTPEKFQGSERLAVVFSAVRSNEEGKMGFLVEPKRLNTAITRAKGLLIVVGNAEVLAKGDATWKE